MFLYYLYKCMKPIKPVTWEEFEKNTSPTYAKSALAQLKKFPRSEVEKLAKIGGFSANDIDKFYQELEGKK
jgi:hypothetical protein